MATRSMHGPHKRLEKGDVLELEITKDLKGRLCFEYEFCDNDPTLPVQWGNRNRDFRYILGWTTTITAAFVGAIV